MIRRTFLQFLLLISASAQASVGNQPPPADEARTYHWNSDTLFTSNKTDGEWVKVTGTFPDGGRWQPSHQSAWLNRNYLATVKRHQPPTTSTRPDGVVRYIEVDKSDFELRVVEKHDEMQKVLLKTTVAVSMDRCLPKKKGGKCYYTDPGEYQVRWKVHNPEGIEWCIPKSMEQEYAKSISRGERCFRGGIGSYVLNIGKTYAIHGTSNATSLGKKVSHGCVRTDNNKWRRSTI